MCSSDLIHAELNKVGLSHLVEARSVPGATAAVATAPTRMVVVLMDPNGGSKELTITSPSPQLLDAVQLESQRTLTAASAGQNRQ